MGNFADPAALMESIALPTGSQNYSGFEDDELSELLLQSRETADPQERAQLVIHAQERYNEVLPWIPTVQPTNVVIMNSELSGAVASFANTRASWAEDLGGK
ncbi:hypothetical protein GCM10027061_16710 [Nesterenkonia suensis]